MANKEIKALFCINTPAQAHTWRNVIKQLIQKGHQVRLLAREYGSTPEILKKDGLQVQTFYPVSKRSIRLLEIVPHLQNGLKASRDFKPSIVIGFGLDAALVSTLIRKPSIIFNDSEGMRMQNYITKTFASVIVTPSCFIEDYGQKQLRIQGYKELAYLHPNYFKPDPNIFSLLNLSDKDKFIILRLNSFDAFHDTGKHGFTVADQCNLVHELEKYARVYISPEGQLTEELEKYRLRIPYEKIHHALYYAQLLVTDTQTMTTEAAILGTPAIRCNSFVGAKDLSNFIELEQKYDLIYSISKPEYAMQKALELIKQPDLKEQWARKRQVLLAEKGDYTQFMVDLIENYPESVKKYARGNSKS